MQVILAEVDARGRRSGPSGQNAMVPISWASGEVLGACSVRVLTTLYFPGSLKASVLPSQEEALEFSCINSVTETPSLTLPGN